MVLLHLELPFEPLKQLIRCLKARQRLPIVLRVINDSWHVRSSRALSPRLILLLHLGPIISDEGELPVLNQVLSFKLVLLLLLFTALLLQIVVLRVNKESVDVVLHTHRLLRVRADLAEGIGILGFDEGGEDGQVGWPVDRHA